MLKSHRWPSISVVVHPQIQPTPDHVVLYVFIAKNTRISGSAQCKAVLFKGRLYSHPLGTHWGLVPGPHPPPHGWSSSWCKMASYSRSSVCMGFATMDTWGLLQCLLLGGIITYVFHFLLVCSLASYNFSEVNVQYLC